MTNTKISIALFSLILVGYWLIGGLFALRTPDWQNPDEPAHYNYVAQIAENGCCPIIEEGDWQQDYQLELTANRFAPALLGRINTIEYEDHQPPLHYLLASIAYNLFEGSLYAIRLFSVLLGTIVVIATYFIGKAVFPEREYLALSAMALVAFLPQHVAVLSSVNNDSLAEAIIAVSLLSSIHYLRGKAMPVWALGILVALGLITKVTTYFLVLIVPLAVILRWWQTTERDRPVILKKALLFSIAPLLLGGFWAIRNMTVYGFPDVLGLATHDAVVSDQLRTSDYIDQIGLESYLRNLGSTTYSSFWGRFGWMAVPLPSRLTLPITALMLIASSGLMLLWLRERKTPLNTTNQSIWFILILTIVIAVLQYLYYNSEFVQFQGRYMYTALVPFALLMALGVDTWRKMLLGKFKHSQWLTVLAFLAFLPFDLYILIRIIVPNLSP